MCCVHLIYLDLSRDSWGGPLDGRALPADSHNKLQYYYYPITCLFLLAIQLLPSSYCLIMMQQHTIYDCCRLSIFPLVEMSLRFQYQSRSQGRLRASFHHAQVPASASKRQSLERLMISSTTGWTLRRSLRMLAKHLTLSSPRSTSL